MWRVTSCVYSVTGGELFEDIVAREFYSEADARPVLSKHSLNHSIIIIVVVDADVKAV